MARLKKSIELAVQVILGDSEGVCQRSRDDCVVCNCPGKDDFLSTNNLYPRPSIALSVVSRPLTAISSYQTEAFIKSLINAHITSERSLNLLQDHFHPLEKSQAAKLK